MRIGLVYDLIYPYTLGGVEHRNALIARRLATADRVTLYGLDYVRRDPSQRLQNVAYASVGPERPLHDARGKRSIIDSIRTALGTLNALARSNDDVWDIANIAVLPVFSAALLARLKRRGLVVTWHEFFGPEWHNYLGPRLGRVAQWLERLAVRVSPRIIAVSPTTAKRIAATGYPAERLHLIPNGVDTKSIAAATAKPDSIADFIYAGRLIAHKRVHLAIEALALLNRRRTGSPLKLSIVGDGQERAKLERLAVDLGQTASVTFHGFLPTDETVFAALKSARVAVLPSAREGFGLTAVQAWAAGIPVVVCDDAENATAKLVTDSRLGRVVPASPDAIADAMLAERGNADAAAWRAAHADACYSLEAMIDAVRIIYDIAERER
jgi:L-malate glycosyltransferase